MVETPSPHATEFELAVDLIWYPLHWSNLADIRPPLATRTIAQMTCTDNTNHPLSAVQFEGNRACIFMNISC